MRALTNAIKQAARFAGVELRRINPLNTSSGQLLAGLNQFGIDLIFDVGANSGQFAKELRVAGYKETVVSFEPLSSAHRALQKMAKSDPKWLVHAPIAIGNCDGQVKIHVAGNSVSSSVLPMLDSHVLAAADSAYVGIENVEMAKLDTVAPRYLEGLRRPFLKIDTQGFESAVLDGAQNVLPQIQGILCELSLVPLYDRQCLWLSMLERFEAAGFSLWAIQPGFTDPKSGRTLQIDAILFRA